MLLPLIETEPDKSMDAPPPDKEMLFPLISIEFPIINELPPAFSIIPESDNEIELFTFFIVIEFFVMLAVEDPTFIEKSLSNSPLKPFFELILIKFGVFMLISCKFSGFL